MHSDEAVGRRLRATGAGDAFGQEHMDIFQDDTAIGTFGEIGSFFTSPAWAPNQVADLEIKTESGFAQARHGVFGNTSAGPSQGKTPGMNSLPSFLSMLSSSVTQSAGSPSARGPDQWGLSLADRGAAPAERSQGDAMRVGMGYDIHRLVPDRRLVLGGIEIPYEKGLAGHSDADVLVHAICDALLGGAGLGDIGLHFPDTDSRYEGTDSMVLLAESMEMVKGKALRLVNLDATIFAQLPKLSPYRDAMEARLSKSLEVELDRVNIKATTTEGLGWIGSRSGMGAMAVVLLDSVC